MGGSLYLPSGTREVPEKAYKGSHGRNPETIIYLNSPRSPTFEITFPGKFTPSAV